MVGLNEIIDSWDELMYTKEYHRVYSGNRCNFIVEESPCSHGSEMTVVFVLGEKISRGNAFALMARINPKSSDMDEIL